MSLISSIDKFTPNPLPSLPPTPTSEEDLSRRWAWQEGGESDNLQSRKSEERQLQEQYADASDEASEHTDAGVYPPVSDDEAETRRVEENLRRWEVVERQRRKAARDFSLSTPAPSLVVDVTRRASLLWPGRKSRHPPRSSLGSHTALKSQESIDAVPLEDIAASPTHSPTHSTNENPSDNPFANPSESLSPFADSQQQTAMMSPSLNPPPSTALRETAPESTISHYRPVLPVSSSSISRPPPPKPLDLPPPRTPPPPVAAPLQAILAPAASRTGPEEDIKETRWWHDWLCGCGEGPDRGGDNQAGRTNPFE